MRNAQGNGVGTTSPRSGCTGEIRDIRCKDQVSSPSAKRKQVCKICAENSEDPGRNEKFYRGFPPSETGINPVVDGMVPWLCIMHTNRATVRAQQVRTQDKSVTFIGRTNSLQASSCKICTESGDPGRDGKYSRTSAVCNGDYFSW
jgi:hypothetical protein